MKRAIVNVATTEHYRKGQQRLTEAARKQGYNTFQWGTEPTGCPSHAAVPYAMKAFALKETEELGWDLLLWCDSCMLPVQSLEPLWQRIERDGYWMSRNGYTNYEWTADQAYPDLFESLFYSRGLTWEEKMQTARDVNRKIPHVVATCFGLNVKHVLGKAFLDEYYRLASETPAFCGPWTNRAYAESQGQAQIGGKPHVDYCGPHDVRGHRHDQTAASVIAWSLGFQLTDPPEIFAYGKAGEPHDPRTLLIADGSY